MLPSQQLHPIGFGRAGFSAGTQNIFSGGSHSPISRQATPQSIQLMNNGVPHASLPTEADQNNAINFDPNTPVSALTAGQMLALIQSQTKPLETKIESIDQKLNIEINGLKTRIGVLENEVKEQKEKNGTLTRIVVEMQRSLNKIDSDDREKNLIINGLPEGEIESDGILIREDREKVAKMFNMIEVDGGPWNAVRLGKPTTNGKTRVVKVVFPSKEARDSAAENSVKLKDLGEPWKKVFLNRDKHPVYRSENNRLRWKMKEYRNKPEFRDNAKERVKINKGELLVDGAVIDKNTFSNFQ